MIATENSGDLPLLQTEAMPEFTADTSMADLFTGDVFTGDKQDSFQKTEIANLEFSSRISTYNSPTAGLSQGGAFGGPLAPLPLVLQSPRSKRMLAPHHASQEMNLYPEPLPPAPVPTPEPSEWILLSTALVALAMGAKFGMVKLERPAQA